MARDNPTKGMNNALYKKRQRTNAIGLTLSMTAMVLGLVVLLWILFVLFSNGFRALDWNMFTQSTPAPGTEGGGLANAIVGSLMMVGFAVLVSTPIGVLAASTWPNTVTPARPPRSRAS